MNDSRGIIMFNIGTKCVVRAIVCLYTIRKYWDGPVTFYLEKPYPEKFDDVCKYFNVDVSHVDTTNNYSALVKKTNMFGNPPYDRTLWVDADTLLLGKIDEMFSYLDSADMCIPSFCDWISNGPAMSKRINRFKGIAEDKHIEKALKGYTAVNTGVLSFKKSEKWKKFVGDWVDLAAKGSEKHIFIPDEVAMQILMPSMEEWGLTYHIAPKSFNVSVRYGQDVDDKRIIHFHGSKHLWDNKLGQIWKDTFKEMCDKNIANINDFLIYADKRLNKYLKNGNKTQEDITRQSKDNGLRTDVTLVTAADPYYIDILKETFPNWRKYKNIDNFPVIVFINGIPLEDNRLDFLRLPNVRIIPWLMDNVNGDHREEMLTAFVIGSAENVQTDYWLKLDADSYATNDKPLFSEEMKKFAFFGHKWWYSRPDNIKKLDEWAKNHHKRKLRNAKPMIEQGTAKGHRFYHKVRRTISFIQLHRTRFTKFCVGLLKERRLPAPTQDTFMFYVCHAFDPSAIGTGNFKKNHGFTQGRGKLGAQHIREQIAKIETININKQIIENISDETEEDETLVDVKNIENNVKDTDLQIISPEGNLEVIEVKQI